MAVLRDLAAFIVLSALRHESFLLKIIFRPRSIYVNGADFARRGLPFLSRQQPRAQQAEQQQDQDERGHGDEDMIALRRGRPTR